MDGHKVERVVELCREIAAEIEGCGSHQARVLLQMLVLQIEKEQPAGGDGASKPKISEPET